MKYFCLLIILLAVSADGYLYAQSGTPTAGKSQNIVNNDFVIWELEMAENGYLLNKSHKNKVRLLSAYEQVVALRCMPDLLQTLQYAGSPSDSICMQYIQKTLEIDSGNPIALCAKNGIGSQICEAAGEDAALDVFDPNDEEKSGTASLDQVLNSRRDSERIRAETLKLDKELTSMEIPAYAERSEETQKKIETYLSKLLADNCRDSRVNLKKEKDNITVNAQPTAKPSKLTPADRTGPVTLSGEQTKSTDPFAALLEPPKNSAAKNADVPESNRIYEISDNCNYFIGMSRKFDPFLALADCYESGFYTWKCVAAKRNEKNRPALKPQKSKKLEPIKKNDKIIDSF